jgi:hypothetical protein
MEFGECEVATTESRIVLAEKRSKVTFLNEKKARIQRILIDGCVITNGIRCDYLLITKEDMNYVELKGSDIKHGIAQLSATIKIIGNPDGKRVKCFLITYRTPVSSTEIQGLQKSFSKKGYILNVMSTNKEILLS